MPLLAPVTRTDLLTTGSELSGRKWPGCRRRYGGRFLAMLEVSVTRLDDVVPLPSYAHPGDAGCDLVTTVDAEVEPGERVVLPTGIALALPEGYAAFVHPRSGLAANHGVGIVNSPGTIDAGYRGEVKVIVVNHDPS